MKNILVTKRDQLKSLVLNKEAYVQVVNRNHQVTRLNRYTAIPAHSPESIRPKRLSSRIFLPECYYTRKI